MAIVDFLSIQCIIVIVSMRLKLPSCLLYLLYIGLISFTLVGCQEWVNEFGDIERVIQVWVNPTNESLYCETPDCLPITVYVYLNGDWSDGKSILITSEECVDEEDVSNLICLKADYFYPCSLFSPWATRILSCNDLSNNDHIFIVPDDRLYMFPSKGPGSRTDIVHLGSSPILIDTLTEAPKIFRITNFLTQHEANDLIEYGRGYFDHEFGRGNDKDIYYHRDIYYHPITDEIDYHRTSDILFDCSTDVASKIKKRTFDLLGLYPYDESMIEGLHISRYREGEASSAHLDWIEPSNDENFDYNSAHQGSNRYISLFFYLSLPKAGGDLLFPLVEPVTTSSILDPDSDCELEETDSNGVKVCLKRKNEKLNHRAKNTYDLNSPLFESGWEIELASQCQNRYTVRPKPLDVIIFYSQKANGVPDYLTSHGICPVMEGEQWVASLHIWNRPKPRDENNSDGVEDSITVSASFESKDVVYAFLYWEDQIWEELVPKQPVKVNTYSGHKWHVKVDNEIVKTWVIQPGKRIQRFILRSEDLPVYYY